MYYTGRLEVFNENFPAVSSLQLLSIYFFLCFLYLYLNIQNLFLDMCIYALIDSFLRYQLLASCNITFYFQLVLEFISFRLIRSYHMP